MHQTDVFAFDLNEIIINAYPVLRRRYGGRKASAVFTRRASISLLLSIGCINEMPEQTKHNINIYFSKDSIQTYTYHPLGVKSF